MAYNNLQEYIDKLEVEGDLVRIGSPVSPHLEMAEIADRLIKHGGPAVLFENTGTGFPVLMNYMGSDHRISMALGVRDIGEITREIESLMGTLTVPRQALWDKLKLLPSLAQLSSYFPVRVSGRGECQEVVMQEPDLGKLPVLTCWPWDGGPFVTLPVVHTRDPENGHRNVGMYRMQVYGPKETGMHWHLHKNGARHYHAYKRLGEKMPVTVTLGGDPAYTYAATAPLPDNVDEYLLAGFLRKKKVRLVRCLTNELEVPADADFVIEGYVDPGEDLRTEGPFGDHTGFYSLPDQYPVFHVTCITHRKNAVFPAAIVGIPPMEDLFIGKATERIFLLPIRMTLLPEILDMHMPAEGVFHNLVLVRIRKTYPGQAVKVMNSLWGAGQMMFNKVMVVLDDSSSEPEGLPALTDYPRIFSLVMQRFIPGRDVVFSRGPVDVLDHASREFAFGGKMGIDATNAPQSEWTDPRTRMRIVPLEKDRPGHARQLAVQMLSSGELHDVTILVFCEPFLDPGDPGPVCWRVLNNIDPASDCYLIHPEEDPAVRIPHAILVVDGTRKYPGLDGITRPWPNCTVSDRETIRKVDERWEELGLGPLLASPSLKYAVQLYPGEAEAR